MQWKGLAVSKGFAVGKAHVYIPLQSKIKPSFCEPKEARQMLQKYNVAVKQAKKELEEIEKMLQNESGKSGIFTAQKEILCDEEVQELIEKKILVQNKTVEYAVEEVFESFAQTMKALPNETFAARAADFNDVSSRLRRILCKGKKEGLANLQSPSIIVAHELLPSDTATMNRENVLAIITETGSITSHAAIFANAYRIPTILGVLNCTKEIEENTELLVDAVEGTVIANPTQQQKKEIKEKKRKFIEQYSEKEKTEKISLKNKEKNPIQFGINISEANEIYSADKYDFVGLFRTEFLYMQSENFPTEEEQFCIYKKVVEAAKGKSVTLRTLDIGGDKTLRYLPLPKEENPFLGKRAIRFCFDYPEVFFAQLRAALRASVYGNLQIEFPMITSMEDLQRAKKMLEEAKKDLRGKEVPFDEKVKVGIMIEVPAVVAILEEALQEIDFASIGTNDLCQYLCAADRMNEAVADYYQPLSPAMLRILAYISQKCKKAGIPLSVCGEFAGTEEGSTFLVGIGISYLSMNFAKVERIERFLEKFSKQELENMSQEILKKTSKAEIEETIHKYLMKT